MFRVCVPMPAASSVVSTKGTVGGEFAWLPSSAETVEVGDAAAPGENSLS